MFARLSNVVHMSQAAMTASPPSPVLIALGANVPGPAGPPLISLNVAVSKLPSAGVSVNVVSPFLATPAFPPSDQPDFLNAVVLGTSVLAPAQILAGLHAIERALGRMREVPWGPRPIDLDLLSVGGIVMEGYWLAAARGDVPGALAAAFVLPHPRLHLRDFVLKPLVQIAPDWCHPALGMTACAMLARLGAPG